MRDEIERGRAIAERESLKSQAERFLKDRQQVSVAEIAFWLLTASAVFVFKDQAAFGAQILIMMLFALSLDLVLGFAGILTLGHAAYFGVGAYVAGLLSARYDWNEPVSAMLAAGLVGGLFGYVSGSVILRYRGLAVLMLTLALGQLMAELANTWSDVTGGFDGLIGIHIDPLLGVFKWDLSGRLNFIYAYVVLLLCFIAVRRIVYSNFGYALIGSRENTFRMRAIGAPVLAQQRLAYAISATIAAIAGALFAQTNAFLTLHVLSFNLSATVMTVVILGGAGRLYGGLVGAIVYMLLEDRLSRISPEYWELGVGVALIVLVLFLPNGIVGIVDRFLRRQAAGTR